MVLAGEMLVEDAGIQEESPKMRCNNNNNKNGTYGSGGHGPQGRGLLRPLSLTCRCFPRVLTWGFFDDFLELAPNAKIYGGWDYLKLKSSAQ